VIKFGTPAFAPEVEQLEAAADVSKQLAIGTGASSGDGGSLEDKFKALEAGSSVDDELKLLMGKRDEKLLGTGEDK
jgi:phage shock protein A